MKEAIDIISQLFIQSLRAYFSSGGDTGSQYHYNQACAYETALEALGCNALLIAGLTDLAKQSQLMKRYYMYNWDETKELFIGNFESDEQFWEYYNQNTIFIASRCRQLSPDNVWHMHSFPL